MDLFAVFERLEAGQSVCLESPGAVSEPDGEMAPGAPVNGGGPWVGLYTSGSTGRRKRVWRRWSELKGGIVRNDQVQGWTWGTSFDPVSFAGVQVSLQAWATGGRVVGLGRDWQGAWQRLCTGQIHALSCTPTYLDLLLQFGVRSQKAEGSTHPFIHPSTHPPIHPSTHPCVGLRQITLGGEVLRPRLGDRVRRAFPQARFTVVYATTELGFLMKTHRLDGWYEVESIERHVRQWRSRDATLEIFRDGRWWNTFDRVEVRGGLIRVIGRNDHVANVGGSKVCLAEVESVAEQVPGVRRAVAVAEPSAVTGQVVAVQYAVEPGSDPQTVAAALEAHLRMRLPKQAWPRQWVASEVGVGVSGKRKSEVRSQKSEVRSQKSEVRSQRSEGRGRRRACRAVAREVGGERSEVA